MESPPPLNFVHHTHKHISIGCGPFTTASSYGHPLSRVDVITYLKLLASLRNLQQAPNSALAQNCTVSALRVLSWPSYPTWLWTIQSHCCNMIKVLWRLLSCILFLPTQASALVSSGRDSLRVGYTGQSQWLLPIKIFCDDLLDMGLLQPTF